MEPLTDQEQAVLAFEAQGWRSPDLKTAAVKSEFGWSLTHHEQIVMSIIAKPAALVAEPMLVRRLQRLKATRRARR